MADASCEPMDNDAMAPAAASPGAPHDPQTADTAAKPANALTPPTSEEMNHDGEVKQEQDDSELSELDLDDDDDGEEIEPDHYWDGGKIPVFKPTMDQFRSFKKFIHKIDRYGMKSGIVKVIPPKEWRDSLPKLDEYVKRIKIKNPITQEFNGTQGIYTQQNVEKQRSYNLPEWKNLTEETSHQPPAKRGERRRNQEKVVRGAAAARGRASVGTPADVDESPKPARKPGRPPRRRAAEAEDEPAGSDTRRSSRTQVPPTPDSVASKAGKGGNKPKSRPSKGGGAGQAKSVTSRRLNNTAEAADYVDEAAFENFDYSLGDLDEFTPERCAELETHYWKSLGFNQPMYAADMPGSLFDDTTTSWNVAKLENLLDVLGTKVPGVNTAYLYMGMWKANFAWHLEDVDLYSINYIHFGAPKQWYSISQEDARKFEKAMKTVWPVDAKNCDQFLRHKTYLISPDVLQKQYGVKVNKLVHYEGEFVITYPYGYHSGYNIGYNCAESVNFATESWLEYGKIARKCNCESDNVWVDVFEIERKLRGEPTPEYFEETDDESDLEDEDGHLPSPPASVKGKAGGRKRKRGPKQPELKKKKKIRIKLRLPTRQPCVMCPNDNPWEPLLSTDNGKKAHRSCASYTPETWIVNEGDKEVACGVGTIDRARLDLRCNFCRSKRGACFQCSAKKCTRAFHATCALAAGVQVDPGMVPTFGEDGTEYYEPGFDFRCKFHRPKMPKNLTVEALENSKRIINYARELKPNDVVQAQLIGAEVFAGLVLENRPSELSVLVEVLPEGERVEVDWKWLCVLDPDESLRPRPSARAIPMPEGMNKKAVSLSNRQDGVPTQDEIFHNDAAFKWHDFYSLNMPPPGYAIPNTDSPMKLRVDLDAADQLYYYLPKGSTEAKCFFTDKPGSTEVAPKANFIQRVQPKQTVPNSTARKPSTAASRPTQPVGGRASWYTDFINAGPSNDRPYAYKPKPIYPATAASATQSGKHTPDRAGSHGLDGSSNGSSLRSFPTEQYYSTKILPAAYPGEHSAFREAVRRESQGSQTMQRPGPLLEPYMPSRHPLGHAHGQQRSPQPDGLPAGSAVPPYLAETSGRTSTSANYQSPYASASRPGAVQSMPAASKGPYNDLEYLEDLKKYPYLYQSFCRRPLNYVSPYLAGGGVNPAFRPSEPLKHGADQSAGQDHSVKASVDSAGVADGAWSPPSLVWDRAGLTAQQRAASGEFTLPPLQRLPPPACLTTHSIQPATPSSTIGCDGTQARLLQDHGYALHTPPPAQSHPQQHFADRTSLGRAYDEARGWTSPKAPTHSPLTDPNTPDIPRDFAQRPTGATGLSTTHPAPLSAAALSGYGPLMPRGGGNEAWRN